MKKKSDEWWDSFYTWIGSIVFAVVICGSFCFVAVFLIKTSNYVKEVGVKNIVAEIWEGETLNE